MINGPLPDCTPGEQGPARGGSLSLVTGVPVMVGLLFGWADRPAVGDAYTAALGNWAAASRPVRAPGGVYTGRRYDVVRQEGAQDGDSRSSLTGAGRGWRGVPGAGRVPPAGAAGGPTPGAALRPLRRERRARG